MCSEVKILDGGFSTQLTRHVGDRIDGDPLWTARFLATNPEAIVKTHLDFLRGGSEIIETCTYQASVAGFVKHLWVSEDEALALIRKSVDLAKEARNIYIKENPEIDANPIIVGSIGPYGAVLLDGSEYRGNYGDKISIEELKEWHKPRLTQLINAGLTTFAFETIPCQKEAEALVSLLSEFPNIKAWLSFSCKDNETLAHGGNFQQAAMHCYKLNPQQIIATGVNCLDPQNVGNLFEGINKDKDNITVPLIVYPNSGEKYVVEENVWRVQGIIPPLETFVEGWLNQGVRYIGGCCRTYAEDISQIKKKVREWQKKQ